MAKKDFSAVDDFFSQVTSSAPKVTPEGASKKTAKGASKETPKVTAKEPSDVPSKVTAKEPSDVPSKVTSEGTSVSALEVALEMASDVTPEVRDNENTTDSAAQAIPPRRPVRTQGKKGARKPRITVRFDPDLYEYIKALSDTEGVNITAYINNLIYEDMMRSKKMNETVRGYFR